MERDERNELEPRPADLTAEDAAAQRALGVRPPEGYPGAEAYGYGYYNEPDDKARLWEMWRAVKKHKWLILALALLGGTLSTVHMYRKPDIFQASALIEIRKENRAAKGMNGFAFDYVDDKTYINTKILMVTSRELMIKVARKLEMDRGTLQAPGPSADGAPAASLKEEEEARLAPLAGQLRGQLSVEPLRDTRAIRLTVTDTDPARAAAIANAISEVLVSENFAQSTRNFTETADWLDRSTRELKARVEQAEQSLATYMRDHGIFKIGDAKEGSQTITTGRLAQFHRRVLEAEADRMLKESLYQEVKAGRLKQLPEAYADSKLGLLETQKQALETELSQLNVKYGPENPRVVEVRQKLEAVEAQLALARKGLEDKLKADYERAAREEQMVRAEFEKTKAEASSENQAEIQFNILTQDVETARALYTDFLQRYNQAKIQVAEQENDLRIIESAQPPGGPIGPQRTQAIIAALFMSLLGGIGLAILLDFMDNTIKSVADVQRYIQLPALGVIPAISGSNGPNRLLKSGRRKQRSRTRSAANAGDLEHVGAMVRSVAMDARSAVAEAYRAVRTSVLLSTADEPPKIMLVTSAHAGEGKTTTAVNTAISLAQLGSSVLLIDCDLRKPTTHKVFGQSNALGVSTYLSSKADLTGLIQKTDIPNLWLLPSGAIPPNPAELISSLKMRRMLQMLAGCYDHVIIDSPPMMHVTDPVILSTMVDGSIIVVHGGKSSRDAVKRVRQELVNVGSRIFGVVLNNVDLSRDGYDYYYYRYYSEYQSGAERN